MPYLSIRTGRLLLPLAALLATCPVRADVETLISGLNTRAEAGQFVNHTRAAAADVVAAPCSEGAGALLVRFYTHPSLDYAPQVAAMAARGGLPYTNWQPYERLLLDLFNPLDEPLSVLIYLRSGDTEHTQPVDLAPGEWVTAQVHVADVRAAGVDVAAVTTLGLRADRDARRMPSRVVLDNVRLAGGDEAAIAAAREEDEARAAARPPRVPRRTDAAQGVFTPADTGERIRRVVEAPVVATPEVLVVGGGLAGVAAAVTAARMGADTLLVERAGALGGMATTGLVPPALNVAATEGIVAEFRRRLEQIGGREQMWNPELMKLVLLEMMRESGAKVMLYALAVDAITEGNAVRGVIVESKSGPQAIRARIVVDCTGDADVAARAGAPFEYGRGRDDQTQTHTLVFLLGNVDTERLLPVRNDIPDLVRQARAAGEFRVLFAAGAAIQPVVLGTHGVVNVNSINVPEVSGLKVEDLTYSHIEAQRQAVALVDFYRKYVPGCEEAYLVGTAQFIGVRESRRIMGEYTLTGEEVLSGAEFPDGIARGFYPVDIHAPDHTGDAAGPRPSRPYEIPYGCLVPLEVEDLLVAGRPISADRAAHGSLRVMGTTMPLGEAAGCAAALCVFRGITPRALPGEEVRAALDGLGAWPDIGVTVADNLALATRGTIATASSVWERGGYPPDAAIDGLISRDLMSRWLSGSGAPPHSLQLELPRPETFSRVRLSFFSHPDQADATQYVPRGFEVQIMVGEDWRTVAVMSDNLDLQPVVRFEPVTARIMRVVFTVSCPADDVVRLREIEVF